MVDGVGIHEVHSRILEGFGALFEGTRQQRVIVILFQKDIAVAAFAGDPFQVTDISDAGRISKHLHTWIVVLVVGRSVVEQHGPLEICITLLPDRVPNLRKEGRVVTGGEHGDFHAIRVTRRYELARMATLLAPVCTPLAWIPIVGDPLPGVIMMPLIRQ